MEPLLMVTLGPPEIDSLHRVFEDYQRHMNGGSRDHREHKWWELELEFTNMLLELREDSTSIIDSIFSLAYGHSIQVMRHDLAIARDRDVWVAKLVVRLADILSDGHSVGDVLFENREVRNKIGASIAIVLMRKWTQVLVGPI